MKRTLPFAVSLIAAFQIIAAESGGDMETFKSVIKSAESVSISGSFMNIDEADRLSEEEPTVRLEGRLTNKSEFAPLLEQLERLAAEGKRLPDEVQDKQLTTLHWAKIEISAANGRRSSFQVFGLNIIAVGDGPMCEILGRNVNSLLFRRIATNKNLRRTVVR